MALYLLLQITNGLLLLLYDQYCSIVLLFEVNYAVICPYLGIVVVFEVLGLGLQLMDSFLHVNVFLL